LGSSKTGRNKLNHEFSKPTNQISIEDMPHFEEKLLDMKIEIKQRR
jgi:hypothetical protein